MLRRLLSVLLKAALPAVVLGVSSGCVLTLETVIRDGAADGVAVDGRSSDGGPALDVPGAEGGPSDAVSMNDTTLPGDVAPLDAVVSLDGADGDSAPGDSAGADGANLDAADADALAPDGNAGDVLVPDGSATDAAPVDASDACVRRTETCNNLDDDCDGVADNNIPPITCGVGACARVVPACVRGTPGACAPGTPVQEVCNGVDDDCNGSTDDGLPAISCGIGACATTARACVSGRPAVCVRPPPMATELCDGIDNNCNGTIDEGCPCARYVVLGATGDGTSPRTPTGTIQGAISSLPVGASATVCVAGQLNPVSSTCITNTVYTENVVMTDHVSVLGGMDPNTWTRAAMCTTTIAPTPTATSTVFFGHGISNATQLDGFTINGPAGATGTSATFAAVMVQEGATITNNVIQAGAGGTSVGLRIAGLMGATTLGAPLVALNTIRGSAVNTTTQSMAIQVSNAAPVIRSNAQIQGGTALSASSGIELVNAPGTQITDNTTVAGGSAPAAIGIHATGDVTNVVIARNGYVLGGAPLGTTPSARGVVVESCVAGRTPLVLFDNSVVGSMGGATGVGVDVLGACSVVVDANPTIIGRSTAGADAMGVRCSGANTNCVVRDNLQIVGCLASASGTATAVERGVVVINSAAAQVRDNRGVQGCTGGGTTCIGIVADGAATPIVIDGNEVLANAGTMSDQGIFLHGVAGVVSNNVVNADGGGGIVLDNRAGASLEVTVVANTVYSPGLVSARVSNLLVVTNEGGVAAPVGVFRDNIAACADGPSNRTAFRESGVVADPRIFENNDLFNCATLYFDADTAASLTDIAAINALADVPAPTPRNNVALNPQFVSATDLHLSATSPLIDLGTSASAPAFDYDRQPRPARGGVDIGADEVP